MSILYIATERIEPGQLVHIRDDGTVQLAAPPAVAPNGRRFIGAFQFRTYATKGASDFETDFYPAFSPDIDDALLSLTDAEKKALLIQRREIVGAVTKFFASIDQPDRDDALIHAGAKPL